MTVLEITGPNKVRALCDDDVALVQAAKQGGIAAFEGLVVRYERRLFQIAQGLLHGVFKSRVLDTDEKFSYTFTRAGSFPYFCSLHPKMTGRVVVQ